MNEPKYLVPPDMLVTPKMAVVIRKLFQIPVQKINGVDLEELKQRLLSEDKIDFSGITKTTKDEK